MGIETQLDILNSIRETTNTNYKAINLQIIQLEKDQQIEHNYLARLKQMGEKEGYKYDTEKEEWTEK